MRRIVLAMTLACCAFSAHAQWDYHSKTDEMTNGKRYFAAVVSTNKQHLSFPYQGGTFARISLRQESEGSQRVVLSINRGQLLCGQDCQIRVRFDDGDIQTLDMVGPDDGSVHSIFVEDETSFIDKLQAAKRIRVEALFFQQGNKVFDFSVSGLRWPPTPLNQHQYVPRRQ